MARNFAPILRFDIKMDKKIKELIQKWKSRANRCNINADDSSNEYLVDVYQHWGEIYSECARNLEELIDDQ
jgi:hypothetical protein